MAIKRTADPVSLVQKQADVIARGVKRIEHIVGDLLDLSRVREGSGIAVEPKLALPIAVPASDR